MIKELFQPYWIREPNKLVKFMIEVNEIKLDDMDPVVQALLHDFNKNSFFIDHKIADSLSKIIGGSSDFWLRVQSEYSKYSTVLKSKEVDKGFDKYSPLIKEMKEKNWIPNVGEKYDYLDQINLKAFFNVKNSERLESKFNNNYLGIKRKAIGTYLESDLNLTALIQKSHNDTLKQLQGQCFNKSKFIQALIEVKKLTFENEFKKILMELQSICNECGVGFNYLSTLSKTPIRGFCQIFNENPYQALITITTKYPSIDMFWQTFFHEAAHLILHCEKREFLILDKDDDLEEMFDLEKEADNYMLNSLFFPYSIDDILETNDFEIVLTDKVKGWKVICQYAKKW